MWLDKLREMKAESGLTTKEIADGSGLPGPTLEKLFAGVTKDPKLGTMLTLVHFFGHTLDDLEDYAAPAEILAMGMELDPPGSEILRPSREAMVLAYDYDKIDERGRKALRTLADVELGYCPK